MKKHDPDDIAPKPHPPKLMDAILDVIIAWPVLETSLTYWISLALNIRPSETGILLGAMDTRTKIDKLDALYAHRKNTEEETLLKKLSSGHKEHVKVRNTIAHAQLLGSSKRKPDEMYFLTSRAVPDEYGFMVILRVPLADMENAARFARDSSADIRALLKARGLEV